MNTPRMRINGVQVSNGETVSAALPTTLSIELPEIWVNGAWVVVNDAQPGIGIRRSAAGTLDVPVMTAGPLHVTIAGDTTDGRRRLPDVRLSIVDAKPPAGVLQAIIADSGTAAQKILIARDSNHNGVREWTGFGGRDGASGQLNNSAVIDRLNTIADAGLTAVGCVSLSANVTNFTYPLAALDAIRARLKRIVRLNMGNEIDWDYVPQARSDEGLRRAAALYHQMGVTLNEAGFDVGSPSFAERNPDQVERKADLLWRDGCRQWDRWIGHAYQAYSPAHPDGWVDRMKALILAHVRVAARYGVPCEIDEIGIDPATPPERAAVYAAEIVRWMRSQRIGYAWFIATLERNADGSPRIPHAQYHPWIDLQSGLKTPMFDAMKAAAA